MLYLFSLTGNPLRILPVGQSQYLADTTILFIHQSPILLTNKVRTITVPLHTIRRLTHHPAAKTLLMIKAAPVVLLPDGVYEVYLTSLLPGEGKLMSEKKSFIGLIDLYSVSAPNNNRVISIDVGNQLQCLSLKKKITNCYLSFRFQGTLFPDGSTSKNNGAVKLEKMSIISINP